MQMKTSQKGIGFIKSFETLQLKAYKAVPTELYFTVGYGHYGPDVNSSTELTKEEAERLLMVDLAAYERAVSMTGVTFTQNQFDALVSFTFNVGVNAFLSSTLLKKIRARASEADIRAEFYRWNKSGGKVLPGLVKRRQAEADMYFGKD